MSGWHYSANFRQPTGGFCAACGKRIFSSRKEARRVLRLMHGDGDGMHAYRCKVNAEDWHVGHMPNVVKEGRMTAAEVYWWRAHAAGEQS